MLFVDTTGSREFNKNIFQGCCKNSRVLDLLSRGFTAKAHAWKYPQHSVPSFLMSKDIAENISLFYLKVMIIYTKHVIIIPKW